MADNGLDKYLENIGINMQEEEDTQAFLKLPSSSERLSRPRKRLYPYKHLLPLRELPPSVPKPF